MTGRLRINPVLVLCLFICLSGCRSAPPAPPSPPEDAGSRADEAAPAVSSETQILQRRLAAALEHFHEGRYEISREILRDISDPANPEIQLLQARIALAQGDAALAAFYLKKTVEGGSLHLDPEQAREAWLLLADMSYEAGDLEHAYRSYLEAVNRSAHPPEARVWLRLAEIAFYGRADVETARVFLAHAREAQNWQALQLENTGLVQRLSRRLSWSTLSPEQFGLNDANISALRVDGDDLWIGTWNGGISRYSIGRRES
ncbi:MAG: hypothetical protein JXB06_06035, partial [Spirochaetales bacterium]|nr:hypothetical protein [Spirochaetales bacterium]